MHCIFYSFSIMVKLDPWTIALYRIIDYITSNIRDPDKVDSMLKVGKIVSWMAKESVDNPAPRHFKDLTMLSVGRLYKEYLKHPGGNSHEHQEKFKEYSEAIEEQQRKVDSYSVKKTGTQPFSYSQLAQNCVENHLRIFFEFAIEYQELEDGSKIPALTVDNKVKFKTYPKKKDRFSKGEKDRYYLAYFMRGELTPNIGMVTVSWKQIEKKYKPLSATLEQAIDPFGKDENYLISFTAKNQRDPIPKAHSNLNYFKFEVDDIKTHSGIVFQCTIDFPDYLNKTAESIGTNHRMIFGTFSAIRKTDSKLPVAGGVVLVETTAERMKVEYGIIRRYMREKPMGKHDDPLIADFLRANYYLADKLVITPQLNYVEPDETPFLGWKEIANELAGNYLGRVYTEDNESQVWRESMKLKINPLGHAVVILVGRRLEYRGIIKVQSESFQVTFPNRDGAEFTFVLKHSKGQSRFVGSFYGYLPIKGLKSKFSSGSLLVEKQQIDDHLTNSQIEMHLDDKLSEGPFKREVITRDRDMLRKELEQYIEDLTANMDSLPDGKLLKSLLDHQSPIFNNKELNELGLPHHMKYITFRIPEKRRFEEGIYTTMFRFEKCDLKFSPDYKDVRLRSPNNSFKGKVYFNGNVILMILNPIDDKGKMLYTDNFFTIQLDAHKIAGNNINDINTLFGTSTWRSSEYIESKMIVLRKAEDDDNEFAIYPMGAHGIPPSESEISDFNNQDLKYNGAFSYLCGRFNRHIHVSSGNGKKEYFRPRDIFSREPFLYAAMHLINKMTETNQAQSLPKIQTFLNEALMHQYASTHFAGVKLDDEFVGTINKRNGEVIDRLQEIIGEQEELQKLFDEIPEKSKSVRSSMQELWPFLKSNGTPS